MCTHTLGKSREESGEEFRKRLLLIQLEELKEKVELNKPGKKHFSTTDSVDFYSGQARFLGDIESRYSRFLDAPLRLSLMKIQDALVNLGLFISIRMDSNVESFFGSQEEFLKSISGQIHRIMKQIYKIHKSGTELFLF